MLPPERPDRIQIAFEARAIASYAIFRIMPTCHDPMNRGEAMVEPSDATILEHCADLDDPRVERTRRHKLVDIIAIAICATICGADSWVHVELFGKSKLEWFQTFLELPGGIPSHDTPAFAGAGFSAMSLPVWTRRSQRLQERRCHSAVWTLAQFQNCFISWTQASAELLPGEVVAIDGKTARRSYDRVGNKGAMHPVS